MGRNYTNDTKDDSPKFESSATNFLLNIRITDLIEKFELKTWNETLKYFSLNQSPVVLNSISLAHTHQGINEFGFY